MLEQELTKKVTQIVGELFKMLCRNERKLNPIEAQYFILKFVLTIFAQKYQEIHYFQNRLGLENKEIQLNQQELLILDKIYDQDLSKIKPIIISNIFEITTNQKQRHSQGMHYTCESDIMKIVRPTISRFWEDKINNAKSLKELEQLKLELANYKVLDPACGSGNFLYVAYQELKRIEQLLFNKINEKNKGKIQQLEMVIVTPNQFYGMDINPFAVELAKVTLMIAKKVAIDKLNLTEPALPLDSLDNNIICEDALFSDWIKADAIIGNPPFLGGKKLRKELGNDYVEKLYQKFKDVKGQPDFCVFWFRKAIDNLDQKGRAGLVGSNSISQNISRSASLDYIIEKEGFIYEAISTQVWSGDANVHVSIVNFSKENPENLFLDYQEVKLISTSLKNEISVNNAQVLKTNKNFSFESCGLRGKGFIITEEEAKDWIKKDAKNKDILKPMIDGRGLIYPWEKLDWVIDFANRSIEDASCYEIPFERVRNTVKLERDHNTQKSRRINWWKFGSYCPNMRKALIGLSCYFAIPKIAKYTIFQPVDITILPCEANMVIASDDFYILGILTSKIHRLWVKAQCSTLKGDTRYTNTTCFETFPFPQFDPPQPLLKRGEKSKKVPLFKGNLGGSNPEKVPLFKGDLGGSEIVKKIRETMIKLQEYRREQMEKKPWGITQLYNNFFNESSSQLSKLHQELDQLVMSAYNFKDDDDILGKLLELNLNLAEKEAKGEKIIGCEDPFSN